MEKHRCRICSKGFASGKSLGGHMRSHLSISAKTQVEEDENPSAIGGGSLPEVRGGSGGGGGSGYELRENPRKTSKFSLDQQKRIYMCGSKECRECGKSFPSWKSLFGHMKCHSAAVKKQKLPLTKEGSSSETSLTEGSTESALVVPRRRRRSRRGLTASSSFVSEFDSEVEQLAFNLVLLSRDSRNWWSSAAVPSSAFAAAAAASCGRKTSFARKRSLNYAISKTMANRSDSEVENYNVKIKKERLESHEASTYECSTCKKIFRSFQALGGHRAAHMRNAKSRAAAAAVSDDSAASTHSTAAVAAGHESSICGKLFCSGPDLVVHKKSRLVAGDIVGEIVQQKEHLILDLNLPVPVEI